MAVFADVNHCAQTELLGCASLEDLQHVAVQAYSHAPYGESRVFGHPASQHRHEPIWASRPAHVAVLGTWS